MRAQTDVQLPTAYSVRSSYREESLRYREMSSFLTRVTFFILEAVLWIKFIHIIINIS